MQIILATFSFLLSSLLFITLSLPLVANDTSLPPEFTTSIGLKFKLVLPGTFIMGAGSNFKGESLYESPAHEVTISKAFYVSETEVTQAQWIDVMGTNPSRFKGNDKPVDSISYEDALVFLDKFNKMENTSGFKLPTEAQWEYAARAGSETNYCYGDEIEKLENYAWYGQVIKKGASHPVAQKNPNAWGLYDMHGNLFEWVEDFLGEDYYKSSPKIDPKGPKSGSFKVTRGGSFANEAEYCQSASRGMEGPKVRSMIVGLRVIKEIQVDGRIKDHTKDLKELK
jgi:formylglycine-generating enzyme required for sulfatase activity